VPHEKGDPADQSNRGERRKSSKERCRKNLQLAKLEKREKKGPAYTPHGKAGNLALSCAQKGRVGRPVEEKLGR